MRACELDRQAASSKLLRMHPQHLDPPRLRRRLPDPHQENNYCIKAYRTHRVGHNRREYFVDSISRSFKEMTHRTREEILTGQPANGMRAPPAHPCLVLFRLIYFLLSSTSPHNPLCTKVKHMIRGLENGTTGYGVGSAILL